jgi:hypothetical protein
VVCTGVWWGKPEGKRPLEETQALMEDNIKIDVHDVGCGGTDWIELGQDGVRWCALVNAVMNFLVP